ncbi:uncharacterized protein [Epargyreus clarus]|uniref:uncharacterized protein n=1 Tax=Epargyreus clarus TaxID=520877 RepID=UPI003C2E1415
MCEQTEINYLDGEVVWVKLGSCWWPGEVVGAEKLPPDVLPSFRKPPIAVVKFFQEDAYEYVKNLNSIYKYNCSRKDEFINKGLYMYRTKHGHMEKFPEDVIRAEAAVGGDITILTRDEFQETKKESYANLFGDPTKKMPMSQKKGRGGRGRPSDSFRGNTPTRKINVDKPNYKVHILLQGSQTTPSQSMSSETASTPSTSRAGSEPADENKETAEQPASTPASQPLNTPKMSSSGMYSCHACAFTTTRLNVLILHNKTHSVTFMPYTPSPVRKKLTKTLKSNSTKTPKARKSRSEKTEKSPKKSASQKRVAEDKPVTELKKARTDEEIKSSLLADWDIDEDSNDESSVMVMTGSPEVAAAAESLSEAAPAELPEAQVPVELPAPVTKNSEEILVAEKPESSSDSKYEFCEDEDWPEEADVGRKIPRVKNPKRKEDTKSISLDDDEVAREVAELLNKTTVPELPSAPEPLKVEENFPEPSIVKSPDKKPDATVEAGNSPEKAPTETQPPKTIFKTKTFFRSRHSRSQDAIGKYVAEQLNAERMDMSEDINGSETPESRISPPIVEPVKIARLAPKIQLKKMKAEAAQMREKEKMTTDNFTDDFFINSPTPSLLAPSSMPEKLGAKDNEQMEVDSPREKEIILDKINRDSPNTTIEVEHLTKTDDILDQLQESSPPKEANSNYEPIEIEVKSTFEPKLDEDMKNNDLDQINSPRNEKDTTCIMEEPLKEQDQDTTNKESEERQDEVLQDISYETDVCAKITNDISEEHSQTKSEDIPCNSTVDEVDNRDLTNENEDTNKIEINEAPEVVSKEIVPPERSTEPYMNESTASAVDALLSVSRDTDRVTKNISNDLPEDLFEDDNKDSPKTINGFVEINDKENNDKQEVANDDEAPDVVSETVVEEIIKDKDELYINDDLADKSEISASNESQNVQNDSVLENIPRIVPENIPSESDLQIAETLINLPSTTIQNKIISDTQDNISLKKQFHEDIVFSSSNVDIENNKMEVEETCTQEEEIPSNQIMNTDNLTTRFETEQEKSENLNAAQSLVQMSESIEHKINIGEINNSNKKEKSKSFSYKSVKDHDVIVNKNTLDRKTPLLPVEKTNEASNGKNVSFETTSPKLLKILEEPWPTKPSTPNILTKQVILPAKEKILNFDVGKSGVSNKSVSPKQKIIIRRSNTPHKNLLNNVTEVTTPDKIILSRSNNTPQDGASVQTYTIQTAAETPSDPNTIVIQQKVRKIAKPPSKLQKLKPHASLVPAVVPTKVTNDAPSTEDAMFDINSMPIVLSDDILTPESIEKMPIVMSDGNIITNPAPQQKIIKTKQTIIESEKIPINPTPLNPTKPEIKTLIMNPVTEINKVTTPNILSKSSKLRGTKMLVIDKMSGKQKIIMTKQTPPEQSVPVKEIKPQPPLMQPIAQNTVKPEKFILFPTTATPRPGRTQKIVIDPQTGKAHMLVGKGIDTPLHVADNKPVSAKLVPTVSDAASPGNTVMIITNAQGAQSRIVLKPEHEKILFPHKQQPNLSQLKTITHRISSAAPGTANKTVATTVASIKNPTRIVPKQKSAIITSKGQLIVGGRVTTTAHNIAPMPEIRPAPKRIISNEPKKLIQTIPPKTNEPLIFFQQKSGAMMQLTAAQFEHLQRTGQIIQKTIPAPPRENKVVVQKTINISPNETLVSNIQKPRVRKQVADSPTPMKKLKQEIPIAPAPTPMPALCPISNTVAPTIIQPTLTPAAASASSYSNLENFEELLPSTAIARQIETAIPQPEPPPAPVPPALSDGQLLAVPGEHFGGPTGSFYLCVEDNGTFTPIDNRPLVLENNQLVPMADTVPALAQQPERRDILEAALANSDVFHGDTTRDEAPDFRDLNANVSVHCRVSETSTTLNQPIMTPVEVPSKISEPALPANLEDGLAVIGVTPPTIPTSLELPITVTDPRIAPKTTDPLSGNNYGTTLLPSPNTEMSFVTTEEVELPMGGPISMPLLTDEESVGKSMPILTDEVAERIVSVEGVGSPSSMDVQESETEDGSQWSRRLLATGAETEVSTEIPLQPQIQISVSDIK